MMKVVGQQGNGEGSVKQLEIRPEMREAYPRRGQIIPRGRDSLVAVNVAFGSITRVME